MNKASINSAIDIIPYDRPRSIYEIQSEAINTLLNEAGISLKDVDGLATNGIERFSTVGMSEYLGISPRWTESSFLGGSSYLTFIKRAIDAVESGYCNIAVVSYGSNQRSAKSRSLGGVLENHTPQNFFEYSQGVLSPLSLYALVAQRGFYEWDINSQDLAEVAVNSRKWAQLNKKAYHYSSGELKVQDVLDSGLISSPLHKLDCCLVTDGGGAVLITNDKIADKLNLPKIKTTGFGQRDTHISYSQMPNYLITGAKASSEEALKQSGMRLSDIDVLQVYDSFTITVLSTLASIGLAEPKKIIEMFQEGEFYKGGRYPLNTSGGGLSYCHPGMLGLLLVIEAVNQLSGKLKDRQVNGASTAFVHGTGGVFSTHASMILERIN